jgi:agmatinase
MHFAYANNSNRFIACEPLKAEHQFAVIGVPFDGAVTNRPGARFGPQEIRRASLMACDGIHPHFNVSPLAFGEKGACVLGDGLDMPLPNTLGLDAARTAIQGQAKPLMAAHHCVFLGGDHSVTLPLLRAAQQVHKQPLALIHFDAHCDTWDDHFGEPSGHGTWTRQAILEGLVDPRKTVQIGIRSAAQRSAREYVQDHGGTIYTARDLRGRDGADLQHIVDAVIERMGDSPCYLTFDIDALDPAFAPGTGTPEPGGLTSSQALTLLEGLSGSPQMNFVAMDCCEVAPAYDHAELTSLAAASLVWTYVCGRLAAK